jgi:NOL1/NOP2/fmu family ribosome biogenesis protein
LKLISYKNKLLNRYLVDLTNHFGINPETLFNFNFLVKGKDIYLTDKNWSDENLNQFNRIGTKFGSFDSRDKITLHSNAAQVLSDSITKRIYQIKNVSDLEKYISGSKIEANQLDFGQYLVKFGEHILGTAINSPDGLKSRFPKTKRTQKIELH